ncbi:unnamed protein product [Prunus armeniaca]
MTFLDWSLQEKPHGLQLLAFGNADVSSLKAWRRVLELLPGPKNPPAWVSLARWTCSKALYCGCKSKLIVHHILF